jgi:hypothetical protein
MLLPSSVGRESTTRLSGQLQNWHFMARRSFGKNHLLLYAD